MWWLGRKGPSGFSASSTAEEVTQGIDASHLTAIVTGATSGIGVETARVLALRGVHVVMGIRNMAAGAEIKETILRDNPTAKIGMMELDLSSLESVRKFAAQFKSCGLPLNILVGFEIYGSLLAGHFLLTNLLLETMKQTAIEQRKEGRIVNVSSRRHKLSYPEGIRFDKINDESGYNSLSAYGQSKLANVLHANELARRLKVVNGDGRVNLSITTIDRSSLYAHRSKFACIQHSPNLKMEGGCSLGGFNFYFLYQEEGTKITANSISPGPIATNLFRYHSLIDGNSFYFGALSDTGRGGTVVVGLLGKYVMKNIQQGAATTCYVALHPQLKGLTGRYFGDSNLAEASSQAADPELARKLWEHSSNLVKS
ncbi:hypothetical protein ACSQ67_008922 [Phaseolus vulgaris]